MHTDREEDQQKFRTILSRTPCLDREKRKQLHREDLSNNHLTTAAGMLICRLHGNSQTAGWLFFKAISNPARPRTCYVAKASPEFLSLPTIPDSDFLSTEKENDIQTFMSSLNVLCNESLFLPSLFLLPYNDSHKDHKNNQNFKPAAVMKGDAWLCTAMIRVTLQVSSCLSSEFLGADHTAWQRSSPSGETHQE